MSEHRWDELYAGPWTVTGNAAKVKVLHELHGILHNRKSKGEPLRILDVGCVGQQPLHFWEPLLTSCPSSFHVQGVDVQGVERANRIARERGWDGSVSIAQGSGYHLAELFADHSFDIAVATQVLEHVARLPLFMRQLAEVLAPGADAFFTVDSAHREPRFGAADPVRLLKNLAKKGLSLVGNERHYDLPWYDREVAAACTGAGFEVLDTRYYNLPDIKSVHNHVVPPDQQNEYLRRWFDLEEALNDGGLVRDRAKGHFSVFYFHVRKPR